MNQLKAMVARYSGITFSDTEFLDATRGAIQKRNRLVAQYGDEDGERLKPYYLAQLIAEQLSALRMTQHYSVGYVLNMGKECAANASTPSSSHPYCTTPK